MIEHDYLDNIPTAGAVAVAELAHLALVMMKGEAKGDRNRLSGFIVRIVTYGSLIRPENRQEIDVCAE